MAYTVVWTTAARRSLAALPEKVVLAVAELVYGFLAEAPGRAGKPLRFELEGLWSARRGDYRIVYRFDEHRNEVVIELVAHRSDVYRRP